MKKISIFILISIAFIFLFNINIYAKSDLDRIDLYDVTVDPRKDGTLDIYFKITWTVLDSKSDGPLEWVKIGIPNYHVDEIKGLTSNIKKIRYYIDSGSFIRIDFDKKYYYMETLTFEFSIHQSYMYHLSSYNGVDSCIYDYHPGWFDEIKVDKAVLRWKASNVKEINITNIKDNYYIYQSTLNYGESIRARVVYNASDFINLDVNKQYTDKYMTPERIRTIIFVLVSVVIILVTICVATSIYNRTYRDPYSYNRGFYCYHNNYFYRPYRRYYRNGVNKKGATIVNPVAVNSSGSSGHGGSCACACACACAGGGRAGCSRKDFYNKDLSTEKFVIINKEQNEKN